VKADAFCISNFRLISHVVKEEDKMSKKTLILLVAIGAISLLLTSVSVYAQPEERMKPGAISPAFKVKIDSATLKLNEIESHIEKINREKIVRINDAENLEKTMYEYAEHMKAALDAALQEAQKAGESKGKEGSVRLLKNFEDTAKAHEPRVNKLAKNLESIEAKIKVGTIKLDKPLLQQMTPSEREEFRKFLAPEGIKNMEKLHPDLFKPGTEPGASLNLSDRYQVVSSIGGFCNSLPEQIGKFFVSPAEAALAAPCVGSCLAQNWAGCVACVVTAGPSAVNAWNDFKSCWYGACGCKWYKPMCCAKKAWCLVKFIGKIA